MFPLVELGAGAAVALAVVAYGPTLEFLVRAVYAWILIVLLVTDWRHRLVFPYVVYAAGGLALASSTLPGGPGVPSALIGGAVAGFLFLAMYKLAQMIYHVDALGFGDVLLAAFIGLLFGFPSVIGTLLLGSILAGIAGAGAIALRLRSGRDFIPFGTFMCLGALAAILLKGPIWRGLPFQFVSDLVGLLASIVARLVGLPA